MADNQGKEGTLPVVISFSSDIVGNQVFLRRFHLVE